jgi:hypothetical protein
MTQVAQYHTITLKGITFVGRRQIEAEYDLTRHKAHRLLVASGIEPLHYFNTMLYDAKKVNTYMESIYVFKKN